MKVLLDECLPRKLKYELVGHEVKTVSEMGWSGLKNGVLLTKATNARFQVFMTIDKNLPFQQNLARYTLSVIVLDVFRNTLASIKPLIPKILEELAEIKPGEIRIISD